MQRDKHSALRNPHQHHEGSQEAQNRSGCGSLEADTARTGIPGSPSSTKKVFEPEKRNTDTKYFEGSAEDMAVQFVDMLANEHLV